MIASGFVETRRTHRLVSAKGIPIDIVPFGDLASDAGDIRWPEEDVEMSILGFEEARTHAEVVRIFEEPALDIPVASPVGLLLLKLVAWGDRDRDLRVKDALDIRHLLENYSRLPHELTGIWDDLQKLEQFDGDIELVAASLLGGAIQRIASTATLTRLAQLLGDRHAALVLDMDSVRATSPSRSASLLSAFETGFLEGQGRSL